jgi:hypothetical protein
MAADRGLSLNSLCVGLLSEASSGERAPAREGSLLPSAAGTELDALARRCVETYGDDLLGIVLFGSAARGELRDDSDVDLLLVLAQGVPLRRRLYRQWDELAAGGCRGHEVNAHFVRVPATTDQAGSLWLEVAVEGVVIFDRRGDVHRFLVALRLAMASGAFVRSMAHGQPYWRRAA